MQTLLIGLLTLFTILGYGQPAKPVAVKADSLRLFDQARNRLVPVVVYGPDKPETNGTGVKHKLAIISHGYGGSNKAYSFIARNLVAHGYLVASIQHELPTDEPLPTTGNPYDVRMPNWQRGAGNIRFVLQELQTRMPDLDFGQLLLLGHSNGGDMSALFAREYPGRVQKLITLDNRRMPLPRTKHPHVLSIRSSDQPADTNVVPTEAEQQQYAMKIVRLNNMLHNDMWDGATDSQKQAINTLITDFLKN